jgi:hypothetical protein
MRTTLKMRFIQEPMTAIGWETLKCECLLRYSNSGCAWKLPAHWSYKSSTYSEEEESNMCRQFTTNSNYPVWIEKNSYSCHQPLASSSPDQEDRPYDQQNRIISWHQRGFSVLACTVGASLSRNNISLGGAAVPKRTNDMIAFFDTRHRLTFVLWVFLAS